ncbi:MAG: glycosyltransferase family 4 protein [Candidatus Cloacimonetes bacterium]|nr:glycosyltransferase family 4 protein [Candidatus Cloacimonadota bacterium]
MRKPDLLYISYFFPPLGGVASIRGLKNVKYLAELGHHVDVLSVQPKWMRHPKDFALQKELPGSVKVWRAFCPDANWLFKLLWGLKLGKVVEFIRHRLFSPGPEALWLPFAKMKLKRILKQNPNIKVAVISSGPPAALFLGLWLQEKHQIPFICDFRDEWTNNPELLNIDFPAKAKKRDQANELRILSAASGVSYLTHLMRDNFFRLYPFLAEKPSAVIPNGFDDSDFDPIAPSPDSDVFRLVYSGSFYDRRQPDPLWQVLLKSIEEKRINPAKFRVDIIGKNTPAFVLGKYSRHPVLTRIVNFHPFVPHRENIAQIMQATALLLYIPSGENTESILTGKIFDYLRSGKPILAIVPPRGLAAKLVTEAGTGLVADHLDAPAIAANLNELYQKWESGKLDEIQVDTEYISQFSRQKLAQAMSKLIEETLP